MSGKHRPHDDRATGTSVPPGAGDEEAGLTGDDPPMLEGDDDYGIPAYSVLDGAGFGFANDDQPEKPEKEAE